MKGYASEITETVAPRCIDLCCRQKTRWRVSCTRKITGKDCIYKFFWSGDSSRLGRMCILLPAQ